MNCINIEGWICDEIRYFQTKTGYYGLSGTIVSHCRKVKMQKDAKSLIYMHFLAWGKLAEEMFEKLKVGSHVLLNGEVNITTRGDDKLTIHLDSFVDLREFNNIDSATIYFKSSNTQKSRAKASHNDFLCDRERENIIKNIASNKQNRQNHDEYADIDF